MRRRSVWSLVLMTVLTVGAADDDWSVRFAEADEVVRTGVVWRCRVLGEIPEALYDRGPFILQVSLTQAGTVLATREFPLVRLGQVQQGVAVALVPGPGSANDAVVEAAVTVTDPQRRDLRRVDRELTTPLRLQRRLESRQRALRERGDRDPQPALWLEQAGELIMNGASLGTCQGLADLDRHLERWLRGESLPPAVRAYRDEIDGSIQPFRLHLPTGGAVDSLAVILVSPEGGVRKSAWPNLPPGWVDAALTAGVALVEAYPAGDAAWEGIAIGRIPGMLAAAQAASGGRLERARVALVGAGRGAAGAIRMAEDSPERFSALALIDPELPLAPALPVPPLERWLALHRAGERPAHLVGLPLLITGRPDAGASAWAARLSLSGNPPRGDLGDVDSPGFWRSIASAPAATPPREWVVLAPGRHGQVLVEELADWGVAGSLRRDDAGGLVASNLGRWHRDADQGRVEDRRPGPRAGGRPRKAAGQTLGPVAGYGSAPFTVVVGTGESATAAEDNRTLARAFASAWAAHAHGRARMVDDTAFIDPDHAGRHLVLIGNPRSNAVLARLTARSPLPVRWDARLVTVAGQEFLRAERRAFALAWPHPAHDGRLLVILDGRPAWSARGLPLAGLPDLFVGGLRDEDQPPVWRWLDNAWE